MTINKSKKRAITLVTFLGLLLTLVSVNKVAAYDPAYVHFEFRSRSPRDSTWGQVKYTTSSYYFYQSKIKGIKYYTATPYGKGNGVTRAVGPSRTISYNGTYYFTNYLVENYGRGNVAWIRAYKAANGSAYGTWYAD